MARGQRDVSPVPEVDLRARQRRGVADAGRKLNVTLITPLAFGAERAEQLITSVAPRGPHTLYNIAHEVLPRVRVGGVDVCSAIPLFVVRVHGEGAVQRTVVGVGVYGDAAVPVGVG